MKLYLSGPMTGLPHLNYPAFHAAKANLEAKGFEVYSPADYFTNVNVSGDEAEAIKAGFDAREVFAEYTRYICLEAEVIAMMPGWERSLGAQAEHALAVRLKLQIMYLA